MFNIMKTEGTRAEVMHGTAIRTSGGLTKKDLKYNKSGRIVSKKKSQIAKNINVWKRLVTRLKRVSLALFMFRQVKPVQKRRVLKRKLVKEKNLDQ